MYKNGNIISIFLYRLLMLHINKLIQPQSEHGVMLCFQGDTSGDYRKTLLILCGGED